MIDLLKLLGGFLAGLFRSRLAHEAEMAFLRQQLLVLKRVAPARLRLRTTDRVIFVWLYRLFPSLLGAAVNTAAPLVGLPRIMVLRFADHLVRVGYASRLPGEGERYSATISGRAINAVMRSSSLR